MMEPTATMVATLEPEIAAKNAQEAIVAIMSPPLMRPKMMLMTRVRYSEVLPREAMVPEIMKNGIASSV